MTPYYSDGLVTIYVGSAVDVLPELDAVDSTITDPPYARDVYLRASAPKTKVGSGTPMRLGPGLQALAAGAIGFVDELILPVAHEIGRLTRRWAVVFSDVESTHRWREALVAEGAMRYARTGAWVKPNAMPQMSGDRPSVGFEAATIVHAKGPMRWNGGGRSALWTHGVARGDDRNDHPCPKPVALMTELVALFTDAGETVLDPFAGSGTTLLAAKSLGRRAIGVEIEERYAEIAATRCSQEVLGLSA